MSKKNKTIIIVVAILLIISTIIGISYAYWRLTYQATFVNKISSSCFSMELTNEKNNITLESAYPISDEKGKSLTPYSFTITNTCDLFASYTINLEMLEGTTLDYKYIKTMINSEAITNLSNLETTETSIEGATESRVLFKGSLGAGDSTDYTLRIWMDSDTPFSEDSMNKLFQSKITVTAEVSTYSPVENGFTNLAEALLVNEYQTTSLDVAKNKITSKQAVDTTKTAPIIEWQETISSNITQFRITKADVSSIGTYGVVEAATKVMHGTAYTFDSESGYYQITNRAYYNPETVDYTNGNYYICNSVINEANDVISYSDLNLCNTIYKIAGLSSTDSGTITTTSGGIVNTKKYVLNVYTLSETELENDKSDKGLYNGIDDDGTTYYYRGNVTNNIVKFAGYYWKVIRINGDGSVRLLYSGNTSNAAGEDLEIGKSGFAPKIKGPTYVGYMYSNTLNTSYEDTISNDNDSTIKTFLDTWYKTNIVDNGHSSYIADSGFCNDRSLSVGDGYSTLTTTDYAPRYRMINHVPTFLCPNPTNDLFTLSGNTKGNQALQYPIGLITADEASFAGLVHNKLNKLSYIYSEENYWTMSPDIYYAVHEATNNFAIYNKGTIIDYGVTAQISVRPVLNLKADTEIVSGIGTKNDPFIVK